MTTGRTGGPCDRCETAQPVVVFAGDGERICGRCVREECR